MNSPVPAPWNLNGDGFILLYHFPESFSRQRGFMQDFQQKAYKGWVGAIMIMDYARSPAGSYQELLFIPGLIRSGGRWAFSVSKIYTSTEISRQSGRQNWGIPKEEASFDWKTRKDRFHQIIVDTKEGDQILSTEIEMKRGSLPVTTRLLPLNRLIQQFNGELLYTRPNASGHTGLASLHQLQAQAEFFPPIHERKPLAVLSFSKFTMHFPPAQLLLP